MGNDRRIPGEGLAERMGARERRRPRIGLTPAFYARLGIDDPWAVAGVAGESVAEADGMVFLSAAPYHAMMRKLAAARRRRDRREARFAEGRAGTTMRAARRAWPGEGKLPTPRIAALSLDAMQFPEPAPPTVVAAATVEEEPRAQRPRNLPAPPVAEPWRSTPFTPARVVRGGSASAHAGERVARAVEQAKQAAETDSLPVHTRAAVARARRRVEYESEAPVEFVEVVRRSRLPRPMVRILEEQVGAASVGGSQMAPLARAAARAAVHATGAARLPASRSPSITMAALAAVPTLERAAEFDRAVAGALAVPERGEAMRPQAARRVPPATRAAGRSAREVGSPAASLSASPVSAARVSAGRPVASAPVARAAAAAGGAPRSNEAAPAGPLAWGIPTSIRPRASAVAMARALHAEPAPLATAAEPTMVVAAREEGRLPAPAVAAPRPDSVASTGSLATPAAVASTVRAVRRGQLLARVGLLSPRVVLPDAPPADGAPVERRVRASAAVQLEGGTFLPARALVALPGAEAVLLSSRGGEPHPFAAPRTRVAVTGAPSEPEASSAPKGAPDRPILRRVLRATVASDRPEASTSWAAERLAAHTEGAPPARSALRRPAPELRLPVPTEATAAAVAAIEAPPGRRQAPESRTAAQPPTGRRPGAPAAAEVAAAARRTEPPVARVETRRAVAARRVGAVAAAVSRAAMTEAPAPAPRARGVVRRSGPLSWARPQAEGQVVAQATAARATPSRATPERASLAQRSGPDFVLPVTALPAALAELRDAGLVQASWSPSTPVRTPDGRYISARVAAALPGLAVLPALGGPTAVSTSPQARVPGFRTPDIRFVGAPSGSTPDAPFNGAAIARTRPTDWVGARSAVSEATAYRGAMGVRTPQTSFVGAASATTPGGEFAGARSAVTATGQFVGARTAAGVAARAAGGVRTTADGAARTETGARGETRGPRAGAPEALPLSGGRPGEGAEAQAAVIAPRAARPSLESTLASVSEATLPQNAPTWAARSDGAPRVRSAQGLFESLARATTAEQVVSVIASRAGEMSGPVPLTEPMRAVVEQLRQELRPTAVAAEGTVLQTRAPDIAAPEATVLRPSRSASPSSSAIVRRGGTRPVRSTATVRGPGGDDRVSKLVKRLTDLIHLAETERRLSEAQAQVRMAEDTAAARAEGSAPAEDSGGQATKLDIESFSREVLEVVNRELELRRERRTEDGDESNWW